MVNAMLIETVKWMLHLVTLSCSSLTGEPIRHNDGVLFVVDVLYSNKHK